MPKSKIQKGLHDFPTYIPPTLIQSKRKTKYKTTQSPTA